MLIEINEEEFVKLKNYLHDSCGIEVPVEKSYLFKTRLTGILDEYQYGSYNEFYDNLIHDQNGELQRKLIEVMTTNETSFFRDGHPFELFSTTLLSYLMERKKEHSSLFSPRLTIWSAACSTGQEPYSLAILINEWLASQPNLTPANISILATDISDEVLTKARNGIYTEQEIQKGMKKAYKLKYFTQTDTGWAINNSIKKMVTFKSLNLSRPFLDTIAPCDMIFCRNVIIYFSVEIKKAIIEQFHKLLSPDGILVLGASENLYRLSDKYESETKGSSIYYRAK